MPIILNDTIQINAQKPPDARSGIFAQGVWRPYVSTTEANTTVPAIRRAPGVPIYIGSSVANMVEYQWLGDLTTGTLSVVSGGGSATTDASALTTGLLAPARIGDASITPAKINGLTLLALGVTSNSILAVGDSLTKGTGGIANAQYPDGTPWMVAFRNLTGYNFFNAGDPGKTSTEVRNGVFAANSDKWNYPTIIWVGTNNLGQNSTILADIAAMVASLGHQRYLVLNLLGHSTPTFWQGTSDYNTLQALNASIASTYGVRAVDARSAVVASFNASNSQDVADHGHDIPPTSRMNDTVHLNTSGYAIVAATVAAKVQYLSTIGAETKILSTDSKTSLFTSPIGIGTTLANVGRFTNVTINKPITTEYYSDGISTAREIVLDAAGNARFLHPAPATNADGGLSLRAVFPNEGGKANMEISGTDLTVWPTGGGINFKNHTRVITIGSSPVPTEVVHTGAHTSTGMGTFGYLTSPGLNFSNGSIHNRGLFENARRALDIVSDQGIVIPSLTIAQSTAVGGSGPYSEGLPIAGELSFNNERSRLQVGYYKFGGYTGYGTVPFISDIPVLANGAGITIAQSGNLFTITNSALPPSSKLTYSAIFTSSEPDPARNAAKAFDGDPATYYQSTTNDQDTAPYIGITLTTQSVITRVSIFAAEGLTIAGGKLQGSNTSTTTGYVDLATLPTTQYYGPIDFTVTNPTPFRYFRILGNGANYVLAAKEIEVYGYQSIELSLTTSGSGAASYNTTTKVLNIPTSGGGATTDASLLTSGTLADTRLSSNIPLKNAASNIFVNDIIISTAGKGFIVKSDDGTTTWRLRVKNDGTLDTVAVP